MYLKYASVIVSFFIVTGCAYSKDIDLVSWNMDGTAAGDCSLGGMSADGNVIVFNSLSSNIVPNDNNLTLMGYQWYYGNDVFLYESSSRTIKRISLDFNRLEISNGESHASSISSDGRMIVFDSNASNITDGVIVIDTPVNRLNSKNVFLYDKVLDHYDWISKSPENIESPVSIHGQLTSDNDVLFMSSASNLIFDTTNEYLDGIMRLYRWNNSLDTIDIISSDDAEAPINLISNRDYEFDVSYDGIFVVFRVNDARYSSSGVIQIALKDSETNEINIISKNSKGELANFDCENPQISGDGRYVVFSSKSTNLIEVDPHPLVSVGDGENYIGYDIFIYDRLTDKIDVIPLPDGADVSIQTDASNASINYDGGKIAFLGNATSGSYNQIYLYDRVQKEFTLFHTVETLLNTYRNYLSIKGIPIISDDGTKILFSTNEDLIVPEDQNSSDDVYLLDLNEPSSVMDWELCR